VSLTRWSGGWFSASRLHKEEEVRERKSNSVCVFTRLGLVALLGAASITAVLAEPPLPPQDTSTNNPAATPCTGVTADGTATANQVAKFSAPCQIHQSQIFDNGTNVGIGNTAPGAKLDVSGGGIIRGLLALPTTGTATSAGGKNSQAIKLMASAFNSATNKAVLQSFQWQVEPAGNNTATPSGTLNLLFGSGTTPAETGLKIGGNGWITFAAGQTFPGTLTGATSGGGLNVTGSTLGLITSCSSGQLLKWSGSAWVCSADNNSGGTVTGVATGLGLTGGPITTSGTLAIDTTVVPQLGVSNNFTVPQFISGYLDLFPSGDSVALYAFNTSTDSTHPTLYVSNSDSTSAGDFALQVVGPNFGGNCTIDVSGNLFCSGTLGAVARTANSRKVGLYTVQASENLIEDVGSGALSDGVTVVEVASDFAQTITADANYRVFLTPSGDCEGLYVTNKTATSFEVRELKNGRSNVQFDYRIVAHRRGFEAARLPDVTKRFQTKLQEPATP